MVTEQIYPEVEKRRQLLGRIQALLEGDKLYAQHLYTQLSVDDLQKLGAELGFETSETLRRFTSLVEGGFIRIKPFLRGPYDSTDQTAFTSVLIEALTDRGLREINVLPPTDSIEGLLLALSRLRSEIQRDPTLSSSERERQASSLETTINGLTATARELSPRVIAEVIWRSISPGQ